MLPDLKHYNDGPVGGTNNCSFNGYPADSYYKKRRNAAGYFRSNERLN